MTWRNRDRGGGIAHNPPFVVPVQVDRRLDPYIPLFTGYALDCIAALARKSQPRELFLKLMEEDDQSLTALISDLAQAVEYYVDSQDLGPEQVESVIRTTVGLVVDAHLAYAISHYPKDFGPLMKPGMEADMADYIYKLQEIKEQAQRFYRGSGGGWQNESSQQRGWQPGGRQVHGGTRGGGWNSNQHSGYRSAADDNWPGNNGDRGNRGGQGRNSIWETGRDTRRGRESDASFNAGAGVRPRRFQIEQEAPRRQIRHVERADMHLQTIVDDLTFVPARSDQEWPKVINTNRRYDRVLMPDGTQMRPAHLSDWKVTFDPETPVTPWYDPQTHVLFHLKLPDGKVVETPVKRDQNMDYFEHELKPELRAVVRANLEASGPAVKPAWNLVESLHPNPSSPLATADPITDDVAPVDVRSITLPDDYLIASSLADGVKRACLRLKVDKPAALSQPFEIYIDRAELTTVVNPDYDVLEELSNAESFERLHQMLMDRQMVSLELATEVDRRIVLAVNQALQQHMGLKGWSITNFQEDFGDLLSALEQDYGKVVPHTLRDNAIEVISRYLAYYKPDELDKIRKSIQLDDSTPVLVWRERSSITRMPFASNLANIPSDTGVLYNESTNPEMYKTLESLFKRTHDALFTFHGRYLAFTDGVVYSLVQGYFNEQSILAFKANFEL